MKNILLLLLMACVVPASAQEAIPPKYQGGDMQYFMARLVGEFEKVVDKNQTPAAELSAVVAVAFRIDTIGGINDWRYIGNTSEGRDRIEVQPATARTQDIMTEALKRLDGEWTPAHRGDRPIDYTIRLTLRVPVEKITKKQDADPLLFLNEDPGKSFQPWARQRIHYDGRFAERGVEGLVDIRFYIEPDGKITIGEGVKSPDEKLTREVIRVIKSSKGRWTPRKVRGVAQRTAYSCRVNFNGSD